VRCSQKLTLTQRVLLRNPLFGIVLALPAYPEFDPAACSVARTLDVLGDTWSVLVLRELFLGAHRFDQIQQHLGIARNILAARLKRLVEHGLIEKRQYEAHPPRFEYHLTRKGVDLQPVLIGLMQWGDRYVADAGGGPVVLEHRACGHPIRLVTMCEACGEPVSPRQTVTRPRRRFDSPVASGRSAK
jgi:DNA-binding HxlR family transcriptional regulator